MKLKFFYLPALMLSFVSTAQSYIGLNTDNFGGVHGVLSNPANVVDSRTKVDINLASASAYLSNDYASVNLSNIFGDDEIDFDDEENLSPSSNNSGIINVDVLGPSFMFNINKKNALAITTRVRSFTNINRVPGDLVAFFESANFDQEVFEVNNVNLRATSHIWGELGLTYGRVFLNTGNHFLKAGVSLKYLQGLGYASGTANNLQARFNPNEVQGSVGGSLEYNVSENFDRNINDEPFSSDDDAELEIVSTGFGFDLGVTYEYRKDESKYDLKNKNKYLLKLGFSITDIGSLSYDDSSRTLYDFNGISDFDRESFEDFDLESNDFTDVESKNQVSRKITLPAAMHLNADWNITNRLYLNLNTDFSFISENEADANRIENNYTLTPRFETQFFSLYSPVGIREFSGFNWGAGFRLGPLYAGSGSIISNLISEKSKSIDVYAGLKIPIYYSKGRSKKIKDIDGDGVVDKEDQCPNEAGTIANNGCPEVVEEEIIEAVPLVEVVEEPVVLDTDGDSVIDSLDRCPNEFGTVANNGCPEVLDTDNDGVPNVLDKCPEVFGVEANKGCPEVKTLVVESEEAKKVEKTLNSYAKVINFNSGKTSFTDETYAALEAIESILKEYPNAKFNINGYTDSVGAESSNQLLSEERALAVKVYFIEKGITPTRLNAVGYGEANPIATNSTPEGRKINRRVEIKLAN